MARHDIHLIALDGSLQARRLLALDHPGAQLAGHALHIVFVQVQLLRDLCVGQVQPHEIQTKNPHAQRLVMTFENSPGQILEMPLAGLTQVPLTMFLPLVMSELDDVLTATQRAVWAFRPT